MSKGFEESAFLNPDGKPYNQSDFPWILDKDGRLIAKKRTGTKAKNTNTSNQPDESK